MNQMDQFNDKSTINTVNNERMPLKRGTRIISYLVIFGLVFFSGWITGLNSKGNNLVLKKDVNGYVVDPNEVDLTMFWKVKNILENKYYDGAKLSNQQMIYGAIKGMTASLNDGYTVYMDPIETAEFRKSLDAESEGIGAELTVKNQLLTVVSPLKDSPAQQAGVMPGDIVYKINGEVAAEMTIYEAVSKIKGPKGTEVTLTLLRESVKEPFDVKIVRDHLDIDTVESEELEDGIWYVEVSQFSDDTREAFYRQLNEIKEKNPKGLILDLRFNGGGYLQGSSELASALIKGEKEVATIKYRDNKEIETLKTTGNSILADTPLIVLINKGTASSSEILAAAIQDWKRGVIMGETSFGKGTVQEVDPLLDGSSIRFTLAKWFTPLARDIDKVGVVPDIEVKYTEEDFLNDLDPQLDEAIKYLKNL